MSDTPLAKSEGVSHDAAKSVHGVSFERLAILYARVTLGGAFLSAVADRFGLWGKYGSTQRKSTPLCRRSSSPFSPGRQLRPN